MSSYCIFDFVRLETYGEDSELLIISSSEESDSSHRDYLRAFRLLAGLRPLDLLEFFSDFWCDKPCSLRSSFSDG